MDENHLRVAVKKLAVPDHWKLQFTSPANPSEQTEKQDEPAPAMHGEELAPPPLEPLEIPISSTTRILIAEDDTVSRRVLASRLLQWGFEPVITRDGVEALAQMRAPDAPSMAIVDWMMPGIDGVEVCRRVRSINKNAYIIMLTALKDEENVVEALKAGADDYVTKPWSPLELEARINVGLRIIGLQTALTARIGELEKKVSELRSMKGAMEIPI